MKLYFLTAFLFLFININAQPTPSADVVLKEARAKAVKENKNVLIIFHASWCVWCRKMDSSLNDESVKDFFHKNYEITHLTILESKEKKNLENAGALEFNKKWGGENQGLPFWIIMDKHGAVLADSQIEPGKNAGCPATAEEVTHFIKTLKKTSSINDQQIAAVEKRFRRNE